MEKLMPEERNPALQCDLPEQLKFEFPWVETRTRELTGTHSCEYCLTYEFFCMNQEDSTYNWNTLFEIFVQFSSLEVLKSWLNL